MLDVIESDLISDERIYFVFLGFFFFQKKNLAIETHFYIYLFIKTNLFYVWQKSSQWRIKPLFSCHF